MNEPDVTDIKPPRPTMAMRVKRCLRWMIAITIVAFLAGLMMIYQAAQPKQLFPIQLQPGLGLANVLTALGDPDSMTKTEGAARLVYKAGAYSLILNFSGQDELVSWTETGPYQVRLQLKDSSCNCGPSDPQKTDVANK